MPKRSSRSSTASLLYLRAAAMMSSMTVSCSFMVSDVLVLCCQVLGDCLNTIVYSAQWMTRFPGSYIGQSRPARRHDAQRDLVLCLGVSGVLLMAYSFNVSALYAPDPAFTGMY